MDKILKWLYWHTIWQLHPIMIAQRRMIRGLKLDTKDIKITNKWITNNQK